MRDGLGCAGTAVDTCESRRLGDDSSAFGNHQSFTYLADCNSQHCAQRNDHCNERRDTALVRAIH